MSNIADQFPDYTPQQSPSAVASSSISDGFPDYNPKQDSNVPAPSVSLAQKAIEPITSYPQTYSDMNAAARDRMSTGVGQIEEGLKYAASPTPPGATGSEGIVPLFKGIANTGMGAIDYVASPINAALHTVVGKPIEENTGIPHEYPEFAASLAIPGTGLTKVGKAAETIDAAKVVPTVEQIGKSANAGYDAIKNADVAIDPSHTSALADLIQKRLTEEGYRPIPNTPGSGVFNIIDELRNPQSGKQIIGPDLTVAQASTPADIEAVRKALNVAGSDPSARGAVGIAKKAIDDFYTKLPQSNSVISGDASGLANTAETARANYAAAKKSDIVTGAENAADLSSAAANSGKNFDNSVRHRFKSILLNPKMQRGFTPDELSQMETIVRGNVVGNTARRVSNLLGGGGGLGQAVATGIGAEALGPVGAAGVSLLGSALKGIENASASSRVAKLDQMIREAAPAQMDAVTQARVKFAADKWARTQTLAQRAPTETVLAKLEAASRGLALALNRNLGMDTQNVFRQLQVLAPAPAQSGSQQ